MVVKSPPSEATFNLGDEVQIQSTATDPQGVTRIELHVDDTLVRTDPSPVKQGQAQFNLIQIWRATSAGKHTVTVRAYNSAGAFADGGVIISVVDKTAEGSNATPGDETPSSSETVTSGSGTPQAKPSAFLCAFNSQYISDVTIPDGSALAPGASFTKTWRVKNTGNCAWEDNFAIVYVSGTQLATATAAPIPSTPPGVTVDISLPMIAPNAPGQYTGTWRLRATNGTVFGTTLTTVIVVPSPATPTSSTTVAPATTTRAPLTATPTRTSAAATGGFAGDWVLNFGKMNLTQTGATLKGTFTNAFRNVNGTLSGTISVNTFSGTYTAAGTSGVVQWTLGMDGNTLSGTFDGSTKWCGARANAPFPNGCSFAGSWTTNLGGEGGNPNCAMTLTRIGMNVTGTYCDGTLNGAISFRGQPDETILNGTWSAPSSGTFRFYLVGFNGLQFRGNWNDNNEWCGWRAGAAKPAPCLK